MTDVKSFDLMKSPLEGTHLIEAGAGTGKTYAITGLFLRLVLERGLSVDEILVVTFTEAATGELKDRIRKTLKDALNLFSGGTTEDAFLNKLIKSSKDPEIASGRLREALRAFDQAAIFTIHGFCMRILHENAFESGSLFDTELITDQEGIKEEIVEDFWRKRLYRASPLFVNYALGRNFSPENLISLLRNRLSRPYLKIIPQVESTETDRQETDFTTAFNKVCKEWPQAREKVEEIFSTDKGLSRVKYGKAKIPNWIRKMDYYTESGGSGTESFKKFIKFTTSELITSVKKGHSPPGHPFFEMCETLKKNREALERLFERKLISLKEELFHYAEHELVKRKRKKNVQSFDDLLLKLRRALENDSGKELAGAVRKKFKAALIDEFQDTDAIQYAIFNKIFSADNGTLFLIGDPKQAIYGFRGADIFAYIKAKKDVPYRHTLLENWRSDPDMLIATNAIFGEAERPFVYDEIPFFPAEPAERDWFEFLRLNGKTEPPFQLWIVDAGKATQSAKALTKTQARRMIPKAVAAEISRLLEPAGNNRTLLGEKRLVEGDIAVLLRTNDEARLMQRALSAIQIPSVLYSAGSLFESFEASEIERLLAGIADRNNERSVRAALSTDMIGMSGEALESLMVDEAGWEKWLLKFKIYHDLWNEHGFFRMFRHLLMEERILPRLMTLPDGERRNTNILHLSEILHQASVEQRLGMSALLKWLSEEINSDTRLVEEYQLRLESDDNAVKLVTVHKSKGLEYPVVFCPFTWDGSRIKRPKEPFTFHDDSDKMRLTLDLGSSKMNENRASADKELLAENLRLFYVALTRAKNRCYLIWGRFKDAGTSAPAYLFHHPSPLENENIVNATGERFKGLSDEDIRAEAKSFVEKACGKIKISEMPDQPAKEYTPVSGENIRLACKKFGGTIDRRWRISSFSSMVSDSPRSHETADRDTIILSDKEGDIEGSDTKEPPSGIFSFPKGAKTGIFLHDIFEHLDFTEKEPGLMKYLVADKLTEYGFDSHWMDIICNTISKVLTTPLEAESEDFRLSQIRNKDRLNELEFYFPLKRTSVKKPVKIFDGKEGEAESIRRLQFSPARGFMRGFIDLVFRWRGRFYLVDWKSNHIGNLVTDYSRESLAEVMKKEYYILQYHIYTLALDQYLRLRIPGYHYEKYVGGVFYIFLRGVDPVMGSNYGIYRDLPSPEFIRNLRKELNLDAS